MAAKTWIILLKVRTRAKQIKKEESLLCNSRQKNDCPIDGKCRTKKTVCRGIASVKTKPDRSYIGLSVDEWKKRYYNHRKSFQNQHYQSETMLSSYVWERKRAIDQMLFLKWSIITVLINVVYTKNMQSLLTEILKNY